MLLEAFDVAHANKLLGKNFGKFYTPAVPRMMGGTPEGGLEQDTQRGGKSTPIELFQQLNPYASHKLPS